MGQQRRLRMGQQRHYMISAFKGSTLISSRHHGKGQRNIADAPAVIGACLLG
jgi:hypothetical protein